MGHKTTQHAPLASVPIIALRSLVCIASLSRYNEHMPVPLGLRAGEKAAERHVGVLLAQAMKIEPGVDLSMATGDPLADTWIERRLRRRKLILLLNGRPVCTWSGR